MYSSKFSLRRLLRAGVKTVLAAALAPRFPLASLAQNPADIHIAPGPLRPTWKSLRRGYKTPEWFRDAKFRI